MEQNPIILLKQEKKLLFNSTSSIWRSTKSLPKYESHILALFHNGSFQTIFIWAIQWYILINGTKESGRMICWSYLPTDLTLKALLDQFS